MMTHYTFGAFVVVVVIIIIVVVVVVVVIVVVVVVVGGDEAQGFTSSILVIFHVRYVCYRILNPYL